MIQSKKALAVHCSMTDRDVIYRLKKVIGGGSIVEDKLRPRCKQVYSWRLSSRREVIELVTVIHPLMGERRRAKIDEMLEFDRFNPKRRQDPGKVSHGTRTMYNKYRCRCDPCRNADRAYERPEKRAKKA